MSDAKRADPSPDEEQHPHRRGPSLTLIYTLIVLAMVAAIVIAAMIVFPFYNHR